VDELATRAMPWEQIESAWARNRPLTERPAIPSVGDLVCYRHNEWSPEVEQIQVLEVQDAGDRADPNLWHTVRDINGAVLLAADGTPATEPVADPWPWLLFRRDPLSTRLTMAREARLRGSAGWLPLDWRQRPERWRLPAQTALVQRPDLGRLIVPGRG